MERGEAKLEGGGGAGLLGEEAALEEPNQRGWASLPSPFPPSAQVTIFYTAPTAIRALHAKGDAPVQKYDRSSLRLLGTVGEPINPEAWRWYYETIGDSR